MSPKLTSEIAARLKQVAKRVGGPDNLAAQTGTARRTLGNYLSGRNEPKLSFLLAVAKLPGVSIDWLVTGEEAEGRHDDIVADDQAPDPPPPSPAIDEMLMGQIAEMVEHLFRSEGARPSARELGQTTARIYAQACVADPISRLNVMRDAIEDERAALRASAAAKPGSRKSTA